ncbi:MAG: UDP-N-acetylmuramoyl-L-alanyl-D-glutamate--2,6-diaminopimelate ligase [Desulfobacterales bacterium]|nr:UDP-N-acetylmuramoyl-L-alanyl-D-glutamate--2,6-diaminopimelate ligase [Desulfobacterales bacterium]
MKLSRLVSALTPKRLNGTTALHFCDGWNFGGIDPDPDIGSIHYRAQDVQPGGLFVAVPGFKADGHDFIDDALARGAVAIVAEKPVEKDTILIEVEHSRQALSALAAAFYGNPSQRLCIIGITGTNGKTTTSYLIENILMQAGFKAGVIGTVNYRYGGRSFDNPMTTPEAVDLQRILAEMAGAGVTHVVLEVSSHAIDLYRIDHCWMDIGVFTNLTHDHHDYHGNMDNYWACKKRLFTEYLTAGPKRDSAVAVINCNDARGRELSDILTLSKLTSGQSAHNEIYPEGVSHSLSGMEGTILTPAGRFQFRSPLVGEHNLENILCAAAVSTALRIPPAVIKRGIETVTLVPGRLEPVSNHCGKFVYVDYAHTPDALEHVLTSLTAITTGRLICVFGCGGDRDRSKRSEMGAIAGRLCDLAVITSDNPRTENPLDIIDEVREGARKTSPGEYMPSEMGPGIQKKGYVVEPDRRRAIEGAIRTAAKGDTVLIAGKGHETYQIIGTTRTHFNDVEEAGRVLREEDDSH